MNDETKTEPPLAIEEPQAPKRLYLWLSTQSEPVSVYPHSDKTVVFVTRPATEADLEALGFVRKP